jgi:hypothetical protein
MYNDTVRKKLSDLGANLNSHQTLNANAELQALRQFVSLTTIHELILSHTIGSIKFSKGVRFRATTPLSANGYLRLLELFGLGKGDGSIEGEHLRYSGELKAGVVPIGLMSGGNLVCIDSTSAVYVWDHEHDSDDGLTWIFESFDEFLSHLELYNEEDAVSLESDSDEIESAWFDF